MPHDMTEKISLVKNDNWERCSCGALPNTYHSQLCGDQNALRHILVNRDRVVSVYDDLGDFAGFMFTRNLERAEHFIVPKNEFEVLT